MPAIVSRMNGAPAWLKVGAGAGAGQHAGHDRGSGPAAGLDVAGGIAGHGQLADGAAAQPEQRGQRQVGPRPAASRVGGGQRQVDQPAPGELVDDGVPGDGGKAGGQANPHPRVAQPHDRVLGPGHGRDRPAADGRGVVVLERVVGLAGGRLVAQDPPEHLDLRLAHARPHGRHRLLEGGSGQAGDRRGEGLEHGAVVGHRGACHVQAGHRDTGHRNVSSAIAGEQVMPQPPGPVTRITPGSTSARWYSA